MNGLSLLSSVLTAAPHLLLPLLAPATLGFVLGRRAPRSQVLLPAALAEEVPQVLLGQLARAGRGRERGGVLRKQPLVRVVAAPGAQQPCESAVQAQRGHRVGQRVGHEVVPAATAVVVHDAPVEPQSQVEWVAGVGVDDVEGVQHQEAVLLGHRDLQGRCRGLGTLRVRARVRARARVSRRGLAFPLAGVSALLSLLAAFLLLAPIHTGFSRGG